MSTKTNFKRVALVAVAALGLGVLTSVAPANAAVAANTVYSPTVGNNPLACQITGPISGVDTMTVPVGIDIVLSGSVVMAAGDILKYSSTGPLLKSFSTPHADRTDVVSADRLTLTATAAAVTTPTAVDKITYAGVSTVGTYYISISENDGGSATSTAIESIKVKVVAACGNNALSLADSFIEVSTLATANDNIDEAASLTVANGVTTYVNLALKDSFESDLTGAGVLLATATNGAVIAWGAPSSQSSTALSTSRGGDIALYVTQGTANAYKPLVTVVTITLDGAAVTTKSITFKGIAASITMQSIEAGVKGTANTNAFTFSVKDAVGNLLDGYTVGAVASTLLSNGVIQAITPYSTSLDTSAAQQVGGFTCLDVSGTGKIKLELTNDIGQTVTSPEYSLTCGGAIYGYTAEFDKKIYAPGEVATLTIKGTDSEGAAVFDAVTSAASPVENTIGAGVSLAVPGMTAVTTPTSSDTFVGGKITYRYTVGSVEGAFNAVVDAPAIDDAVTIAYTIKSSSTAVSNADVLKAIVSLIASINKQIAALQKALLKKK
jgi:hypothetical protein